MTELKLRQHYVDTLRGWIGAKEGSEIHKRIIDTYNSMRKLPRNYAVTYSDAWCAATVSAASGRHHFLRLERFRKGRLYGQSGTRWGCRKGHERPDYGH